MATVTYGYWETSSHRVSGLSRRDAISRASQLVQQGPGRTVHVRMDATDRVGQLVAIVTNTTLSDEKLRRSMGSDIVQIVRVE